MTPEQLEQIAVQTWRDKVTQLERELAQAREERDGAYLERNRVVAALAKCFPSGVAKTAIAGWSDDWHGCVYIDLPTGQVSWHYHDFQAYLFADLPSYTKPWDGHDTEEKYRRVAALRPNAAQQREERYKLALLDFFRTSVPEGFTKEQVKESRNRIKDHGGTLDYIAGLLHDKETP